MDKFEQLQINFHRDLDDLIKNKKLSTSDAAIVRDAFKLCAKRVIKIELINMIEFAKAEGLL